jgi:hypothetical protein
MTIRESIKVVQPPSIAFGCSVSKLDIGGRSSRGSRLAANAPGNLRDSVT